MSISLACVTALEGSSLSSQGPSAIKVGESLPVRAEYTLLTHLTCVLLLYLRNLWLGKIDLSFRVCKGFGTLYKFHFSAGLRKAQRGLLCLKSVILSFRTQPFHFLIVSL